MLHSLSQIKVRVILGVPVHALNMQDTLKIIDECIQSRQKLQLGVVNAAKIVNMWRQPGLREDVLSSDLILADGSAVVVAGRLLGQRLPERITGIDLMYRMLERGNLLGYRIYCLGATEKVSQIVADKIAKDYPGIEIVGRHHGYFKEDEADAIAEQISITKPDILFVAMTSPKKEKFLSAYSDKIGSAVCHGVGGSFDVYAGQVMRAPLRWQKAGLEWLYRLKQEPKRLWRRYLETNMLFIGLLTLCMAKRAFGCELRKPFER